MGAENLLRRLGFDVFSIGKDVLLNDSLLRFHPDLIIANYKSRLVDGIRVISRVEKFTPSPRIVLAYSNAAPPNLTSEQQSKVDAMITMPIQPTNLIKVISLVANLDHTVLLGKYQKILSHRLPDARDVVVESKRDSKESLESVDQMQFLKGTREEIDSTRVTGSTGGREKGIPENSVDDKRQEARGADPVKSETKSSDDPWGKREKPEWDPMKSPGQAATARSARSDRYEAFLRGKDIRLERTVPREKVLAAGRQLKRDSESEKEYLEEIEKERKAFVDAMYDKKDQKD